MFLIKILSSFIDIIRRGYNKYIKNLTYKSRLGYCGRNVDFRSTTPCSNSSLSRVFLYDNTNIYSGFSMISHTGRFIMKKNSGSSIGLTVITGNHNRSLGYGLKEMSVQGKGDVERDVIVEEDVWIGANVTLLAGVTIGRGATIGTGSICTKSIPPYAIVLGNPAKVIGFNFSPEEVIEHEKILYSENERLPITLLEKNYYKYFLDRAEEIKQFLR